MPRPKCCRNLGPAPDAKYFKPRGIPATLLETVALSLDEYEAVRLADSEGLYHEDAARKMNISRQTFGRTIETARKKIADVLINGKALKIEDRVIAEDGMKQHDGPGCGKKHSSDKITEEKTRCPYCHRQMQ